MASLIDILKQAGFSGSSLNTAYAIAMAESGGNAHAYNGNASTGDKSYGLFQINMLGGMGPERLKQYGLGSNDDLYDAVRNAQVAFKMSKGGTDWSPWSTYKRGDYRKYLGQSGADVSGSTAAKKAAAGQAAPLEPPKPQADFLKATVAPGLAAPDADPFAAPQGDPTTLQTMPKAPATPGANPAANASSSMRDKIISFAMQQLGTPYSWGGGGTGGASKGFAQGANTVGFDCSSLMMYAFGKAGYDLPRVSWDQLKQGTKTSIANLQPGDLVGFHGGSHIALYLGNGKILEAPHTGANVRVRSLGANEDAWGVHLSLPGD